MVAHTLSGPAVNAEAAGGASQVLPSISIKVNPEVKLVNSVLLTDQVTIACGAFISQQFGAASLEIVEAVGNSVAHSYANVQSLRCDGAPHVYTVSFLGDNIPFITGGDAAVSATANACGTTPSFQSICQDGQVAVPVTVRR